MFSDTKTCAITEYTVEGFKHVETPQLCQDWCRALEACRFFTWYDEGCYLLNSCEEQTHCDCCVRSELTNLDHGVPNFQRFAVLLFKFIPVVPSNLMWSPVMWAAPLSDLSPDQAEEQVKNNIQDFIRLYSVYLMERKKIQT